MLVGTPSLGFTFNPVKIAKKTGSAIAHPIRSAKKVGSAVAHPIRTVKAGVREAGDAAKQVGHALKVGVLKPAEWLAAKATAPLRNRVHTLRNRRAAKLAWDSRKSKTPNAQEQAQAKAWTKSHLKGKGPHGQLLALFAGAPAGGSFGGYYGGQLGVEPATMTLIAASIPVFMALMNRVLSGADRSGEAPANPQADAAANASDPMPGAPGEIDVGPAQDAAAEAVQAVQEALPPPPGMVRLPGGMTAKKSHLLIGGAVVGGLVLITLLMPKKS